MQKQALQCLGVALISTIMISGCTTNTAGNYQPIVDGPRTAQYKTDLNACQQLAAQRSYMNDDVKVASAVGGIIGALAGAGEEDSDSGDVVAGALVGATVAGGERAWESRAERKSIIMRCMQGRGHRVVG